MNLEKYGPFMHSGYMGLYLVSITSFFYAYILPWQRKDIFVLKIKYYSNRKKEKDLPDKKHKKDLGKII